MIASGFLNKEKTEMILGNKMLFLMFDLSIDQKFTPPCWEQLDTFYCIELFHALRGKCSALSIS